MSALRRRRGSAPPEPPAETNSDTDVASANECEEPPSSSAPQAATHSKGDNKMSKIKKRLKFGTLLLGGLFAIVAAGHLWILGLVCSPPMLAARAGLRRMRSPPAGV